MSDRGADGPEVAAKDLADVVALLQANRDRLAGEELGALHPSLRRELRRIRRRVERARPRRARRGTLFGRTIRPGGGAIRAAFRLMAPFSPLARDGLRMIRFSGRAGTWLTRACRASSSGRCPGPRRAPGGCWRSSGSCGRRDEGGNLPGSRVRGLPRGIRAETDPQWWTGAGARAYLGHIERCPMSSEAQEDREAARTRLRVLLFFLVAFLLTWFGYLGHAVHPAAW